MQLKWVSILKHKALGGYKMKLDELKEIVEIIQKAKIDVLKLEKEDFKLYYQKEGAKGLQIQEGKGDSQEIHSETDSKSIEQTFVQESSDNNKDLHQITSPMIGAFYSRANPDSEPFVEVGSKIAKQDIVCILEAMKLLNEIKSDV